MMVVLLDVEDTLGHALGAFHVSDVEGAYDLKHHGELGLGGELSLPFFL
jgi:hypothetical protein